ncbi:MAG TPA: PQQ-dependent sugar dehydrogenase, partial [Acidimicrobiia bacterium]|nr:PQQ-dependent sugar dehydrogenase [Acidimicrobiia bacterium]
MAIAFRANDARMYVAEQGGRVRIVANGSVVTTPVLTLAVSHGDEQGLLGIAFSPDGSKLYTDITDPNGNTHVDEWTMHGDVADPKSRRELLYQPQPYPNHNGGEVLIGPDGMLYIGFGDGGSGGDPQNRAQNLGTWLGKILRINPNRDGASPYSVPADNPFVGRAGARHEIWMYGLRNPWRFSFDRATGATWIGDVGQDLYEEVDYAPPHTSGINWGWSAREGFHPYNSVTAPGARNPVLETTHHAGNCAIVGGYVYRGTAIAGLAGTYIFGDDCNPALMGVIANNGTLVRERALGLQVQSLTTFGEDQHGE